MPSFGVQGFIRAAARRVFSGLNTLQNGDLNEGGDLLVAQGLPERTDLVRMGNSYTAQIAAANAFSYVAALPTTRAELLLYNNATTASKICIVIDTVWIYNVTSMGAAQPITLVVQNCTPSAIAAPTDGTTTIVQTSLSGGTNALTRVGSCLFALANTAFCLANHWDVIASTNCAMTTNLGQGLVAPLFGGYVVKPGGAFGINAVAGTAAGTATVGVKYHEVVMTAA